MRPSSPFRPPAVTAWANCASCCAPRQRDWMRRMVWTGPQILMVPTALFGPRLPQNLPKLPQTPPQHFRPRQASAWPSTACSAWTAWAPWPPAPCMPAACRWATCCSSCPMARKSCACARCMPRTAAPTRPMPASAAPSIWPASSATSCSGATGWPSPASPRSLTGWMWNCTCGMPSPGRSAAAPACMSTWVPPPARPPWPCWTPTRWPRAARVWRSWCCRNPWPPGMAIG